ncbi:S53 family peptidase [Streptomyces beihaiensis]|uniref:S53 family peptidase n=1 Tax=Streptomyces beihaiensis TaxID=2984495 RepID=A0ABT3TY68_9ACTN|nr:S53 family peptidase [Streptomyces beihaiensis]MCX3061989.1 S53 family peptidase [Streptomyces beihaiensis]
MIRRAHLLAVPLLAAVLTTAVTAVNDPDRLACEQRTGTDCYTFGQLRTAYGIDRLARQGLTGTGRTVAVVDFIGAPGVRKDLQTFSDRLGLPAPDLRIVHHAPHDGPAAPFDWKNDTMASSAEETTMDLEAVHAFAPEAKLVLHQIGAAPRDVDDQLSPDAFAALIEVLGDIVEHRSADVVSLSLGFPERGSGARGHDTYYKKASELFRLGNETGMTFVAASGDNGVFDPNASDDGTHVRTTEWPASAPHVTGVGGTRLHLDDKGRRTGPDTVWNDDLGASGGGLSKVFDRPRFQAGGRVAAVAGGRRAVPDISMTASGDGSTMVYITDAHGGSWQPLGGTSLAAPLFAGVVALADQRHGGGLGDVNTRLYALAPTPGEGARAGVVDVTSGINGAGGHRAGDGYDLASGLGTVDAVRLVPALAR